MDATVKLKIDKSAELFDTEYILATIRAYLRDWTRVRIDYVAIIGVDFDNKWARVEFAGGEEMNMRYGLGTPGVGQTWRARRMFGDWMLDDIRRP